MPKDKNYYSKYYFNFNFGLYLLSWLIDAGKIKSINIDDENFLKKLEFNNKKEI